MDDFPPLNHQSFPVPRPSRVGASYLHAVDPSRPQCLMRWDWDSSGDLSDASSVRSYFSSDEAWEPVCYHGDAGLLREKVAAILEQHEDKLPMWLTLVQKLLRPGLAVTLKALRAALQQPPERFVLLQPEPPHKCRVTLCGRSPAPCRVSLDALVTTRRKRPAKVPVQPRQQPSSAQGQGPRDGLSLIFVDVFAERPLAVVDPEALRSAGLRWKSFTSAVNGHRSFLLVEWPTADEMGLDDRLRSACDPRHFEVQSAVPCPLWLGLSAARAGAKGKGADPDAAVRQLLKGRAVKQTHTLTAKQSAMVYVELQEEADFKGLLYGSPVLSAGVCVTCTAVPPFVARGPGAETSRAQPAAAPITNNESVAPGDPERPAELAREVCWIDDVFANQLWDIVISRQCLASLRTLSGARLELAVKGMARLGTGRWTARWKAFSAAGLRVPVYATAVADDLWTVWQVDVDYRSSDLATSHVIRVWDVAPLSAIDEAWVCGCLPSIHGMYPDKLVASVQKACRPPSARARPGLVSDDVFVPGPSPSASAGINEAALVGLDLSQFTYFYTLDVGLVAFVASRMIDSGDCPFRLAREEIAAIRSPRSVVCVGRSGTGKTTCLIFRLFKRYADAFRSALLAAPAGNAVRDPDWRQMFVTASPFLCQRVREYFHRLRGWFMANTEGMRAGDDLSRSVLQAVRAVVAEPRPGAGLEARDLASILADPEDEESEDALLALPATLFDLREHHWPLFTSYAKLLRMLDAGLGPVSSFFARRRGTQTGGEQPATVEELRRSRQAATEAAAERKRLPGARPGGQRVDFLVFGTHYWPHLPVPATRRFDAAAVYCEIMGVIKGGAEAVLTREQYVERARPRAPLDRQDVYALYEAYERKRIAFGDYDDQDLARYVVRCLGGLDPAARCVPPPFDEVYVDEAQDLSPLQTTLLLMLCRNPEGLFFTGDTAQTISRGSVYRFQDTQRLMYQHFHRSLPAGTPAAADPGATAAAHAAPHRKQNLLRKPGRHAKSFSRKRLQATNAAEADSSGAEDEATEAGWNPVPDAPVTRSAQPVLYQPLVKNYRTHCRILRLAGSLLELLEAMFPDSFDRMASDVGSTLGPMPVFLETTDPAELQLQLFDAEDGGALEFGAEQVVLVREEPDIAEARASIPDALVMTIEEAKGLEFTDVLIFNFWRNSPAQREWRVLYHWAEGAPGSLPAFDAAKHHILCGELKFLYTAITRARHLVVCFDADVVTRQPMLHYWTTKGLITVLQHMADSALHRQLARKSTPAQWRRQGLQLLRRRLFDRAMHCFARAGDDGLHALAEARHLRHQGLLRLHAEDPEAKALLVEAAAGFVRCRELHRYPQFAITAAQCHAAIGSFNEGGRLLHDAGFVAEAAAYYKRGGDAERCGRLYEELGQLEDALQCYSTKASLFARGLALVRAHPALEARPFARVVAQKLLATHAGGRALGPGSKALLQSALALVPADRERLLLRFGSVPLLLETYRAAGEHGKAGALLRRDAQLLEAAEEYVRARLFAAAAECAEALAAQHLRNSDAPVPVERFMGLCAAIEAGAGEGTGQGVRLIVQALRLNCCIVRALERGDVDTLWGLAEECGRLGREVQCVRTWQQVWDLLVREWEAVGAPGGSTEQQLEAPGGGTALGGSGREQCRGLTLRMNDALKQYTARLEPTLGPLRDPDHEQHRSGKDTVCRVYGVEPSGPHLCVPPDQAHRIANFRPTPGPPPTPGGRMVYDHHCRWVLPQLVAHDLCEKHLVLLAHLQATVTQPCELLKEWSLDSHGPEPCSRCQDTTDGAEAWHRVRLHGILLTVSGRLRTLVAHAPSLRPDALRATRPHIENAVAQMFPRSVLACHPPSVVVARALTPAQRGTVRDLAVARWLSHRDEEPSFCKAILCLAPDLDHTVWALERSLWAAPHRIRSVFHCLVRFLLVFYSGSPCAASEHGIRFLGFWSGVASWETAPAQRLGYRELRQNVPAPFLADVLDRVVLVVLAELTRMEGLMLPLYQVFLHLVERDTCDRLVKDTLMAAGIRGKAHKLVRILASFLQCYGRHVEFQRRYTTRLCIACMTILANCPGDHGDLARLAAHVDDAVFQTPLQKVCRTCVRSCVLPDGFAEQVAATGGPSMAFVAVSVGGGALSQVVQDSRVPVVPIVVRSGVHAVDVSAFVPDRLLAEYDAAVAASSCAAAAGGAAPRNGEPPTAPGAVSEGEMQPEELVAALQAKQAACERSAIRIQLAWRAHVARAPAPPTTSDELAADFGQWLARLWAKLRMRLGSGLWKPFVLDLAADVLRTLRVAVLPVLRALQATAATVETAQTALATLLEEDSARDDTDPRLWARSEQLHETLARLDASRNTLLTGAERCSVDSVCDFVLEAGPRRPQAAPFVPGLPALLDEAKEVLALADTGLREEASAVIGVSGSDGDDGHRSLVEDEATAFDADAAPDPVKDSGAAVLPKGKRRWCRRAACRPKRR